MVFSSLLFLYLFLPITLILYFISPAKGKNIVLLIVSLIFYAWGEPVYVGLIIFSSLADYGYGLIIAKFQKSKRRAAKLVLILSLVTNLAVLFFFKYVDFIIENINYVFGTELANLDLPLPIGISFYTFQTMSYIIDVYRGKVKAQRNFISFAMYVTLFPQLIAGPIVRYEWIEKEIAQRHVTFSLFSDGVKLFIIGLGKKVLIANQIGLLWEEIQGLPSGELSMAAAWLGIIAFSFQIYFDFSGYSDMAMGLGKMLGFQFPQNFNYPYISRSISEFWRRWHMTLGGWFREYVYIPLGGNRKGKMRTSINLLIVWMLTGFWHGASWNFIIWGLYFGVLILLEKVFLQKALLKLHPIFQHLYFIFFILVGWVFFLFDDLPVGLHYLVIMFGFSGQAVVNQTFLYLLLSNLILLLMALIGSIPLSRLVRRIVVLPFLQPLFYLIVFLFSSAYLVGATYNPFLYFRF
ncbi:MBOAT family protein [Bacillus sp. Bva_UNVM-123]|uniref:MBOAT family O-acyltransferase n=1 Tax=Bacillus sp. Bva_UNVM-123 TaxID=2829798 RepID=UPI00391F6DB3